MREGHAAQKKTSSVAGGIVGQIGRKQKKFRFGHEEGTPMPVKKLAEGKGKGKGKAALCGVGSMRGKQCKAQKSNVDKNFQNRGSKSNRLRR